MVAPSKLVKATNDMCPLEVPLSEHDYSSLVARSKHSNIEGDLKACGFPGATGRNGSPSPQALQGSVIVSFGGSVRGSHSSGHHGSEFPADIMAGADGDQCVMSKELPAARLIRALQHLRNLFGAGPLQCGREPRGHRLGRRIAEASGFGEGGRGPDGLPAKLVLCKPLMRSETCSMWSALLLTCRCVCSCTRSIDGAGGSLFVACFHECVLARFLACLLARTIAVVAVRCR